MLTYATLGFAYIVPRWIVTTLLFIAARGTSAEIWFAVGILGGLVLNHLLALTYDGIMTTGQRVVGFVGELCALVGLIGGLIVLVGGQ